MRFFLFLFLLLPELAQAAEPAAFGWVSNGIRMLGGLVLVIGLMLLIFAVSRRHLSLPGTRPKQQRIKVLEQRHFGPKRSIALVEVKGEELLIGIGQGQMNLICRFSDNPDRAFSAVLDRQMDTP